jgi:hypothetical protein
MDDSYLFCSYEAIFSQCLRHFQHIFANFEQDPVYQCKIPCLAFGAHHRRYNETLNKLRQRVSIIRPNRNTNDVLLLHDNARPHTSLRTREGIRKMGWAVSPRPAHPPTATYLALYRMHNVD